MASKGLIVKLGNWVQNFHDTNSVPLFESNHQVWILMMRYFDDCMALLSKKIKMSFKIQQRFSLNNFTLWPLARPDSRAGMYLNNHVV